MSVKIQTQAPVARVEIHAQTQGGGTEITVAEVSQGLVIEPKQALTILVGLLYQYIIVATAYVKARLAFMTAQIELKEVTVEYNRAVEAGKDAKTLKELRTQLQALQSIFEPNTSALESIRAEIILALNKVTAVQNPYKAEGNAFYSLNDKVMDFAEKAAKHNTEYYEQLQNWANSTGTDIRSLDDDDLAKFSVKNEMSDFIRTSILPLHSFAGQIMGLLTVLDNESLNELASLAAYLDGHYFTACEVGTEAIIKETASEE